jgi:hypothetical protein
MTPTSRLRTLSNHFVRNKPSFPTLKLHARSVSSPPISPSLQPPPLQPTSYNFPLSPIPRNPLGEGRYIKTAAALIIGYRSLFTYYSKRRRHIYYSDEILNAKTRDTNSHHFARYCFEKGIDLYVSLLSNRILIYDCLILGNGLKLFRTTSMRCTR